MRLGVWLTWRLGSFELFDQVLQFWEDQLFEGEGDGFRRTGEGKNEGVLAGACDRPRGDRPRANFGVAEPAKQLTKPRQGLFEEAFDGVVGGVAGGDACAAIEDNGIEVRLAAQGLHMVGDRPRLIRQNDIPLHPVPLPLQRGGNLLAACVSFWGAGIAHGHDGADHRTKRGIGMGGVGHHRWPWVRYSDLLKPRPFFSA